LFTEHQGVENIKIRHVDHIGNIVKDLAAAKEFFVDLGFTVLGESKVQREWVERIIGLKNVREDVVMVQHRIGS
jgi:catechol 2,3-dioxygenase-like lactoylglutathione lyase family enzyme